jgi:hypothetical protein
MTDWWWVVSPVDLSSATNTVILSHTMPDLEIFILILGDSPASNNMFAVRAPGGMSVDEWRELVHSKSQSRLKGVAAIDLHLWVPFRVVTAFAVTNRPNSWFS